MYYFIFDICNMFKDYLLVNKNVFDGNMMDVCC